jgi:hypothetical protein
MKTCRILNVTLYIRQIRISHFQVRLLAKSHLHKFSLALKADVFAICIKKYRFLAVIKTGLKSVNKTTLMSEVS